MLYTYAIIADYEPRQAESLIRIGILPDAPPRCYRHGTLAAVASEVPASEFGPEALPARLSDAEWTRDRVLAHEAVVTDLLQAATVLPMKFCTLFSGEPALFAALDDHGDRLLAAVARCRSAREWGVKLFFDPERAEQADAATVSLSAGAGAAFFRRKQEARAKSQADETRLAECVADVHEALARRARDAVLNPPQPPAIHRRRGRMVLNAAYLVGTDEEIGWHAAIENMTERCARDGLGCELTGPWGPYNFVGGGLVGA
ncbi:GvpL/GvpF family gas vesicle protein [Segnochrobactrum spirostomi]|uniref:GvpL/GvpF family gas vesicle protein n=1 Tax=Segnochrobactrum spirostomi TaxID=2608987 RepID=A0A6A7Y699_9HYPH|nr:GvpL/GvpF family gas vesicle protein [Segnochrobactrum spirostomi]MQT14764.1 GvpL/GvpF family gas vesicle protein [Segnochrobactrum spirostomi]